MDDMDVAASFGYVTSLPKHPNSNTESSTSERVVSTGSAPSPRPSDVWIDLTLRKKILAVFDTDVLPMLIKDYGWQLQPGARPCDRFFLPPGVKRGRQYGFKPRVDFFDSNLRVMTNLFDNEEKYKYVLDKAWEAAQSVTSKSSKECRRKNVAKRNSIPEKLNLIPVGPDHQVDPDKIPPIPNSTTSANNQNFNFGTKLCICDINEPFSEVESRSHSLSDQNSNGNYTKIVIEAASVAESRIATWSRHEMDTFYELMLVHRKDIYKVQENMPESRPCSELLQYYYSRVKSKAEGDEYFQDQYKIIKNTCFSEDTVCRNDEDCYKCMVQVSGIPLLCCEGCPRVCHLSCAGLSMVPEGDWFCDECTEKNLNEVIPIYDEDGEKLNAMGSGGKLNENFAFCLV